MRGFARERDRFADRGLQELRRDIYRLLPGIFWITGTTNGSWTVLVAASDYAGGRRVERRAASQSSLSSIWCDPRVAAYAESGRRVKQRRYFVVSLKCRQYLRCRRVAWVLRFAQDDKI